MNFLGNVYGILLTSVVFLAVIALALCIKRHSKYREIAKELEKLFDSDTITVLKCRRWQGPEQMRYEFLFDGEGSLVRFESRNKQGEILRNLSGRADDIWRAGSFVDQKRFGFQIKIERMPRWNKDGRESGRIWTIKKKPPEDKKIILLPRRRRAA